MKSLLLTLAITATTVMVTLYFWFLNIFNRATAPSLRTDTETSRCVSTVNMVPASETSLTP